MIHKKSLKASIIAALMTLVGYILLKAIFHTVPNAAVAALTLASAITAFGSQKDNME